MFWYSYLQGLPGKLGSPGAPGPPGVAVRIIFTRISSQERGVIITNYIPYSDGYVRLTAVCRLEDAFHLMRFFKAINLRRDFSKLLLFTMIFSNLLTFSYLGDRQTYTFLNV